GDQLHFGGFSRHLLVAASHPRTYDARPRRTTARPREARSPNMLISLRSKGASWIVKGLFVILIRSFALWGIPDIYRNIRSAPVAATVGDTKITADELRRAVDFNLKNLQRRTGNQLDPELLRQLGLVDRTLDGLIEPALLEAYGADLGMAVPDDMVE